jgi:hypothetical protein
VFSLSPLAKGRRFCDANVSAGFLGISGIGPALLVLFDCLSTHLCAVYWITPSLDDLLA